ncbi:ABC transporter permease [Massilia glaciei]|uniref:Transport permease protein n=1 Tax=Massilia glaciei TaxID=1524097 RepID=A0A2U2HJ28_9BURK|nr:ABC transporter permease [Massilia glaciei]PWF46713.1 ABC transporter permease [Massilia glaciei]
MNTPTLSSNLSYSVWSVYATEARLEFIRMLRMPMFALPALLFPAMFYSLFGLLMARGKGGVSAYMLATYCIFGVMGPGLFGFGVSVAVEKDRGWLTWRRAVPALPGAYFVSKMIMAMIFAFIIFLELAVLAATLGGVHLEASQWSQLMLVSLLSSLPFCALGLVIGILVNAQAAPAVVNFIYLPMAFLSGLWLPISLLPQFLGKLAPIWPSYHAAQIALKVIGADLGAPLWHHIAYLVMFTLAMAWLAVMFWSRMKVK